MGGLCTGHYVQSPACGMIEEMDDMPDNRYFAAPNIRNLGWVPRWTIMKRHHQQSVAEHSYFVALYSIDVANIIGCPSSMYGLVVEYALVHDLEETFTGDLPGPYKRNLPNRAPAWISATWESLDYPPNVRDTIISRDIISIVKTADLIDSFLYLEEEIQMGNKIAAAHIGSIRDQLIASIDKFEADTSQLRIELQRLVFRSADWALPQVIRTAPRGTE